MRGYVQSLAIYPGPALCQARRARRSSFVRRSRRRRGQLHRRRRRRRTGRAHAGQGNSRRWRDGDRRRHKAVTRPHRVTARRSRRGGSDGAGLAGLSASAVTERAGERVRPAGIASGLPGRRSGRRCLGADVCRNPQPGEGCAGAHLRARNRGYGRGHGRGSAPVQAENRGTVFTQKPGISPASGVHFHHYRGSTKPVVPRVSAINPRNPRYPRFDFRGRT